MKKLTCHCGGVEAEVNVPETGFEKSCVQLFSLQKKRIHNDRSYWTRMILNY